MVVRSIGTALCFGLLGASLFACGDPAPLPRVHVTISNLHDALNGTYDANSVSLDVIFASASGDAGSDVRRSIYWDRRDTFDFYVQIPAGMYGAARLEAHALVQCVDMGPYSDAIVATGHSASTFTVLSAGDTTDAPTISAMRVTGCR